MIFFVITAVLFTDIALARLTNLGIGNFLSQSGLVTFLVIMLISIGGQNLILVYVKSKMKAFSLGYRFNLSLIIKLVSFSQYCLAALLLTVLFQVAITQGYNPLLLKIIMWISYLQAISLTAFLLYKFLSWLVTHKSLVIFLYTLAIGTMCLNLLFTVLHVNELILNYSTYVTPEPSFYLPDVNAGGVLTIGFEITSILSYLLMWLATVALLRSHSRRLGRIRYWSIVSIILIYFIIQFPQVLLQLFATYRLSNPLTFSEIYTLFFVMSKPIGGILFAAAFWIVGRKVGNLHIRDFMVMSAYGLILFFTSNQAIILDSFPYPPFGLVTISFIGLAALLLLIGVYSAALSIAHDSSLRASIRISLKEYGFLRSISASEIERYTVRKAVQLTKSLSDIFEEESGVGPSLDEEDVKNYIEEVIGEIKK